MSYAVSREEMEILTRQAAPNVYDGSHDMEDSVFLTVAARVAGRTAVSLPQEQTTDES